MMMRSRISFLAILIAFAIGCGDSETTKKKVNQPCLDNSDCLDNICHTGICASANPHQNGESCGGNGECRSFLCVSGSCQQGQNPSGTACLYNEECSSASCVSGKCASGPKPDAGVDLPATDAKPDAPAPDGPRGDGPKPDTAHTPDGDSTPPEVLSIVPADKGTLGATSSIVITWNETVKPQSLALGGDLVAVPPTTAWAKNDTELTITPSSPWPDGASRSLTVQVKDLVGNTSQLYSYSFTVDSTPPMVTAVTPTVDYKPWTSFTLTFSKEMDQTSLVLSGDIGAAKIKQWTSATEVEVEPQTTWSVGDARTLLIEGKDKIGNALKSSPVKHVVDVHYFIAVATTGDVGQYPSLRASSSGLDLQIAYVDATGSPKQLMFVKSADGGKTWSTPVAIDSSIGAASGRNAMAVVGSKIFVGYNGNGNGDTWQDMMFHRSDDGGATWPAANRKAVAQGEKPGDWGWHEGQYCSMAVAAGKVYLAWHEPVTGLDLEWHTRFTRSDDEGATWPAANMKSLDACMNTKVGMTTGIAVLGSTVYVGGNHHALGGASGMQTLYGYPRLARSVDSGANWTCHTPESNTSSVRWGEHASLCASGLGGGSSTVYMAYYDTTGKKLRFARSDDNGTSWASPNGITLQVDGGTDVGQWTSLAVDATGDRVYVAYYDASNKDLKFARSDDKGATWPTIRSVDSKLNVGLYPSIAISGSGAATAVSVSYYDESNGDLRFARSTNNGESW